MTKGKGRPMVAPDGGWGWITVLGVSVVNLATRSIEPSFGLLFGDELKDLGVETTGAAVIMSTMDAVVNFSGLFVGPLIKLYSYRKVAIVGAILSALGLMLTSPANSIAHIIATYSIVGGLGVGFAWSSTFVALNHYFSKYRGQAIGLSMAGTAVGMMAMPQAIQLLLEEYQFRGTVLVLGAIALNAVAGACLLQPIKWHLKPKPEEKEEETKDVVVEEKKEVDEVKITLLPPKIEVTSEAEDQLPPTLQKRPTMPRITSSSSMTARRRKESVISNISSMDFTGSSFHIHTPADSDDEGGITFGRGSSKTSRSKTRINDINKNIEVEKNEEPKEVKKESSWRKVIHFLDLDLLKDPIYLNILFGLSIFYVAELNFKMIVPFFLADLGYTKSETAFYLSMTAVADISARLVLPPICDRVNIKRRTLFAIATVFLALSRSALAEQTEYVPLMIALVVNGFFRGATLINFTLTISEHCSLEKLPAAFGLHMVAKGLFIVALGPVIGVIRDATGSFPLCIHSQTLCIFLCLVAWGIEYIVLRMNPELRKKYENVEEET